MFICSFAFSAVFKWQEMRDYSTTAIQFVLCLLISHLLADSWIQYRKTVICSSLLNVFLTSMKHIKGKLYICILVAVNKYFSSFRCIHFNSAHFNSLHSETPSTGEYQWDNSLILNPIGNAGIKVLYLNDRLLN